MSPHRSHRREPELGMRPMLVTPPGAMIPTMGPPPARELLARVHALPGARPLLERLGEVEGVYLVGGAVRDLLLGEPPDLDLVVEGDAAAVAARLGGELRTHDRFGTSTVRLDGHTYDFARARTETYAYPGALPDVAPASLAEDLLRRDFTVNAMAIALGGARAGELSAAPFSLEDLDARRLRVLHERSFIDDPTRLLRLARYAGRLGFDVEPSTRELVTEAIHARALKTVSGNRIGAEVRLLARERDPIAALGALRALELDEALEPGFGLADPSLARRALELLGSHGHPDRLVVALALRGVASERRAGVLDRLAFPAAERDPIVAAADGADELAQKLTEAVAPSEIMRAAGDAPPEAIALAGALGPARVAGEWLGTLRHVRLEIGGDDLLVAGIPEGPAIGRALRAALAAKLDGRAEGRDAELAAAIAAAAPGRS